MSVRRKLLWVSGAFLLLLLAGLVLPYLLRVDHYREEIVRKMEEVTGRPVTIGKLRARFLPRLGFSVDGFRLGNPRGFPQGDFITAEAIHGTLAFWPLLSGELRLTSVEMIRPRVRLLNDPSGKTNYMFSKESDSSQSAERASDSAAILEKLELTDAELSLGQVAPVPQGRETAAAVTPFLKASNLSAELRGLVLGEGALKRWQADAGLEGVRLEVAGLSGPIVFRSGFVTLRDGALVAEFEVEVPGAPATKGGLRVPDVTDVRAAFEVTVPELNIAKALAGQAAPEHHASSRPSPAAQANTQLAEGTVRIGRVRWGNYQGSNAQAQIRVFGNRIEIAPARLDLYDGQLVGSLRLARQDTPQRFRAEWQLSGLNVAALLSVTPETRDKLTGTAEMKLALEGTTDQDARRSLAGTGQFAIRDGKFPRLDLGKTMRAFATVQRILNFEPEREIPSGETTFRSLQGDLTIRDERVFSRRIELDSSVGIFTLRGSVGFDGTLEYDGRAVLEATEGGGAANPADLIRGALGKILKQDVRRLSIPFVLRGTLAEPKLQPGRGLPEVQTSDEPATGTEKKKNILDLFRRP